MRILDENNVEITSPNFDLGYLVQEEMFVAHHEAVKAVEEKWHYETIATYPNGGKDVKKVIDVPGVEAREAWDEYEKILRYILYTEEELAEIEEKKKNSLPNRMSSVESDVAALTAAIEKGLAL